MSLVVTVEDLSTEVVGTETVVNVTVGDVGPQGATGPTGPAGTSTVPSYTQAALPAGSLGELARTSDGAIQLLIHNGWDWLPVHGTLNVKDFGAIGDAAARHPLSERFASLTAAQVVYPDATALTEEIDYHALRKAISVAGSAATPLAVYVPAGFYWFEGPAIPYSASLFLFGDGPESTTFLIKPGEFLFDENQRINRAYVGRFRCRNGKGLFRSTYTGSNVDNYKIFEHIEAFDYTGCCVSHNASDSPYWVFRNCTFKGLDYNTTMGVALSGLTDGCVFDGCDFQRNRVQVKVRQAGVNLTIRDCAFIRFSTLRPSGPAIDIWFVPRSTSTNAGNGVVVGSGVKFGNENLVAGDLRVCYADAIAGTFNDDEFPSLASASTGYVVGHVFKDSALSTLSTIPFIFSTTPNVIGTKIGPMEVTGTRPSYWLEFLNLPVADLNNTDNILGPISGLGWGTTTDPAVSPSNAPGFFGIVDPISTFDTRSTLAISRPGAADPVGYVDVLSALVPSYDRVATVGGTTGTDFYGGSNAVDITGLDAVGVYKALTTANITVGMPMWAEFDLKQSGASPLTKLYVQLRYTANGLFHWRRVISVPATWQRFRFPVTLREKSTTILFMFATVSGTGSISIGRPRIYHAREPLNVEGRFVGKAIVPGGVQFGSTGPQVLFGAGTPEGTVTASVGSTFHRTDGGAGTSFYVKESGVGNTGWVAK